MYPIQNQKYGKKVIFTAAELVAYKQKVGILEEFKSPSNVILTYQQSFVNYFKKRFKVKKITGLFGTLYIVKTRNIDLGIVKIDGVGAPVTASVMEDLISLGAKRFVILDMAGALADQVKVGEIVVCDRAVRDEGTSYHYVKASKFADGSNNLVNSITIILESQKLLFHVGTSWSTDAPYRETLFEIEQHQQEGVLTVEMSIAAAFTLGTYYKVEVAGMFIISDSLADLIWKPEVQKEKIYRYQKHVCETAITVLDNYEG